MHFDNICHHVDFHLSEAILNRRHGRVVTGMGLFDHV